MTRKVAVFYRPNLAITIHRTALPFLDEWRTEAAPGELSSTAAPASLVALAVVREALWTFRKPLDEAENALEVFETALFSTGSSPPGLRDVHTLKRRAAVIRSMSRHLLEMTARMAVAEQEAPLLQDIREDAELVRLTAEELLEESSNLLHVWLALSAQKTNQVMRILTIFSVFFMPLTFIVGIYGMNFDQMPELRWTLGYPAVLVLMAGVSVAIYFWFRRKGWLTSGELPKD